MPVGTVLARRGSDYRFLW